MKRKFTKKELAEYLIKKRLEWSERDSGLAVDTFIDNLDKYCSTEKLYQNSSKKALIKGLENNTLIDNLCETSALKAQIDSQKNFYKKIITSDAEDFL